MREAGDTLLIRGKRRRLGDLSRDCGLPTVLREAIPVLTDGKEILWAPFVGAREGILAGENTPWGYRIVCMISDGMDKGKD